MQPIQSFVRQITVGTPRTYCSLTLFPLFSSEENAMPTRNYVTLDEALAQNLARVSEVSEGGSVPQLRLVTEGARPVLLLDGEELVGAKQNRVLNLTLLAPAGQEIVIPVSCVEAGRWNKVSAQFATSSHAQFAEGRARKMARVTETMYDSYGSSHYSNQSEVWADIAAKAARLEAHSDTSAMSDIYEKHEDTINEYASAFPSEARQVGAAFAINGKVVGIELFDCPSTLARLLPKLTRSYALDAIDKQEEQVVAPSLWAVETFLNAVADANGERFAAIGLGEDLRWSGKDTTGAALLVDEKVIQLSAFRQI